VHTVPIQWKSSMSQQKTGEADEPRQQNNEDLHFQSEWCRVGLARIGDAVNNTGAAKRGRAPENGIARWSRQDKDFGRVYVYLAHSFLLIMGGSALSVASSIMSRGR
jgi:hypothetical protein